MQRALGDGRLGRRLAVYAAGVSLLAAFLASMCGVGLAAPAPAPAPMLAVEHQTDLATIPRPLSVSHNHAAHSPDVGGGRTAPTALPPVASELPAAVPVAAADTWSAPEPGWRNLRTQLPRAPPGG